MAEETFTPATTEWYYPPDDVVKNAHVPDYEAVYKEAMSDIESFWTGTKNGTKCSTVVTRRFSSGSWAARPTSS